MKGNISLNDKVYKISSKALIYTAKESYKGENRKIALNCKVVIKKNKPISITVTSANPLKLYKYLDITCESIWKPTKAKNKPLTEEIVLRQINKTNSTPYYFKNVKLYLDKNLFLPKISTLNELRRIALETVEKYAKEHIERDINKNSNKIVLSNEDALTIKNMRNYISSDTKLIEKHKIKVSLLLNNLNLDYDYSSLNQIDNLYIPLKYFTNKKYGDILKILSKKANIYIYMPTIIKGNYKNLFYEYAKKTVKTYDIRGFVISNIGNIKLLNDLFTDLDKYFKIVANYTFNIFNYHTILELKKLGISKFVFSPESTKSIISSLCNYRFLQKELIVYGRTPLMNMNYCLLGESNKCYPECSLKCRTSNNYYLKDRLNMDFPIISDNIQTVSTLYNSKITSIEYKDFLVDSVRIDILDENINQINDIIDTVKNGNRFEGNNYTNGNLNRDI